MQIHRVNWSSPFRKDHENRILYCLWDTVCALLFCPVIDLGKEDFHGQPSLWFTMMIWNVYLCPLYERKVSRKVRRSLKAMPQNGISRRKTSAAICWHFLCEPESLVGWLGGRFAGSLPCLTQASKTVKLPFYRGHGDSKRPTRSSVPSPLKVTEKGIKPGSIVLKSELWTYRKASKFIAHVTTAHTK